MCDDDYDINIDIIKKAKDGDELSKDKIFEKNVNLIWHIVNKLNISYEFSSNEKSDLFQIGAIGLVKALKNFDLNQGVKFSTFAFSYILGEIKMFLRDDGMIKISREVKNNVVIINRLKDKYEKLNQEFKICDIEKETGLSKEDIIIAMNAANQILSIDDNYKSNTRISSEKDNMSLCNTLSSEIDIEEDVIRKCFVKEILKKLDKEERLVIINRYFKEKSQNSIGELLNISQVKVSRIESRALNKIRMSLS